MGSSGTSSAGNGAVITVSTVPSAPIGLTKDTANTFAGQIAFSWSDGASNGGQPIDYYQVQTDQSTGVWIVLASQVSLKKYTATGLIAGNTYRFVVQSHNAIGFSTISSEIAIIAATLPTTPAAPTTAISGTNVLISWVM